MSAKKAAKKKASSSKKTKYMLNINIARGGNLNRGSVLELSDKEAATFAEGDLTPLTKKEFEAYRKKVYAENLNVSILVDQDETNDKEPEQEDSE